MAMTRARAPERIDEPADLAFLTWPETDAEDCVIDLQDVGWISPLGVVAVLAACRAIEAVGVRAEVVAPQNIAVRTYLHRIGFYPQLEAHHWEIDDDDRDIDESMEIRACLPVSPIGTEYEVEQATESLRAALVNGGTSANYANYILTIAAELIGNAREHGSECYAVAQTHSGKTSHTPGVHLAVADFGPGFAASLAPHHGPLSDAEALRKGVEDRVSGTGDQYRGMGLNMVLDTVEMLGGARLCILSRTACFTRAEKRDVVESTADYRGTVATVYVPNAGPAPILK